MKLRVMLNIIRGLAVVVLLFFAVSRNFIWVLVLIVLFMLERTLWRTIAQCPNCHTVMPTWDGYKHKTCPKCGKDFTYKE